MYRHLKVNSLKNLSKGGICYATVIFGDCGFFAGGACGQISFFLFLAFQNVGVNICITNLVDHSLTSLIICCGGLFEHGYIAVIFTKKQRC